MTNNEALNILKCNSINEVDDSVEVILFDYKAKFLQQIPPLKIINATIVRVKQVAKAYDVLKNTKQQNELYVALTINKTNDLVVFLKDYQKKLSEIRLEISQANTPSLLINKLNYLIELQQSLFLKLSTFQSLTELELNQIPIKLSEPINVFGIQTQLSQTNIDQNKISEYIRTQIKTVAFKSWSELTKGVVNAQKQIVFNGIRREI